MESELVHFNWPIFCGDKQITGNARTEATHTNTARRYIHNLSLSLTIKFYSVREAQGVGWGGDGKTLEIRIFL